jgi:hypothetical protein
VDDECGNAAGAPGVDAAVIEGSFRTFFDEDEVVR